MTTGNADPSQGQSGGGGGGNEPPSSPATPGPALSGGNKVYKSGPLYLSSKGIGWTSWKKRWFILTRTSLVFFRSDPNAVPQKGSEVNVTLGGIDLNSSGSVVVKEDKKLITVLFPDGRDGRAFTLKAETMEDLHEWKVALEEALANAPAAVAVGQNGILRNDQPNAPDASYEQYKDRPTPKSLVIGRPILLALEDIDGTPSFLEKALRFLEEYGVKVEGILRQAADVDDVEHRIREYEKGKTEFSPEEDPHIIADCIKYVLRELPSSPVPASCCNALLEAFRTDRSMRVNAMRSAICETFPEPNRRLLQRILMMMQTVASHKAVNRMSISAVAACMAPLLLRPLLAGDCELENDFDVGGDGSVQLLQAAAAANHAQAIVITLLEDYENIFGEGSVTPEPYTDSEESGTESEELTDDDDYDDSFDDDDDEEEATEDDYDVDVEEDSENELSATSSETDENENHQKVPRSHSSGSESPQVHDVLEGSQHLPPSRPQISVLPNENMQWKDDNVRNQSEDNAKKEINSSSELIAVDHSETSIFKEAPKISPALEASNSSYIHGRSRRPTVWGRTPAKKNLSMESIDINFDDESEIQNLESVKEELQKRIETETKTNSLLLDDLQRRKHDLHAHRLALEKDVARLQEELQKQMELRALLEGFHGTSQIPQFISPIVDVKVKADLEEIAQAERDVSNLKQKAHGLQLQLNQQRELNSRIEHDSGKSFPSPNHHKKSKEKQIDGRVTAISNPSDNLSGSKHESYLDKPESGKGKKLESASVKKPLPPNQQTDGVQNSKDSVTDMGTTKLGTTVSKKSSSQGTNSTTSALSKLTNRLNFLKERRSQIASELQNLDKGRNSCPVQNPERGGGSEQNMDKSSEQNMEKNEMPKGQEKGREIENNNSLHKLENVDKGRNSECHPNVDWGKSESFPVVEKGSKIHPRTFSR